ncbi:glycosyltransferase family protein [Rubrivirga sp.]|uniref:glycosyltransferase family protein n=1 Tax=Rubrivirga sp. TaxID=1885344 RepID=UPI003C762B37
MACVVYALSGQGRGHTSRGLAVADGLRGRGHDVVFCGGGTARSVLEDGGEQVIPAPTLRQVMRWNRLLLLTTGVANAGLVFRARRVVRDLREQFLEVEPDLVISDFDAFAHRAAADLGVPVVTVDHQQIVTETQPDPPVVDPFSRFVASQAVQRIVARTPERRLISTFYQPPLRDPNRATFVGPILRREILGLEAETGEHVLVYVNGSFRGRALEDALAPVDARFVVYGLEAQSSNTNVEYRTPSHDRFLRDLAGCRAVICTAGFTLISEALYLGKPVLAIPNGGIYEQALNAAYLERQGRGRAAKQLTTGAVQSFLKDAGGRSSTGVALEDGLPNVLDAVDDVLEARGPLQAEA